MQVVCFRPISSRLWRISILYSFTESMYIVLHYLMVCYEVSQKKIKILILFYGIYNFTEFMSMLLKKQIRNLDQCCWGCTLCTGWRWMNMNMFVMWKFSDLNKSWEMSLSILLEVLNQRGIIYLFSKRNATSFNENWWTWLTR